MPVIAMSLLLGYCGLIYEFVFAQSLSLLFGNTVVQYSLTLGLFILGMGIGSSISERFKDPQSALWRVQLELSVLTPVAGFLLWWKALVGWTWLARALGFGAVLGVGILCGMELPLLLRLPSRSSRGLILGADYVGMLLACAIFPLVLLPWVGLLSTLLWTALLNSLVLVGLAPGHRRWTSAVSLCLILAIALEPLSRAWLSRQLAGG